MRCPGSRPVITRDRYDAALLDLDGAITDSANLHAACCKQMFDEKRAKPRGEAFLAFDAQTGYRLYADGKTRSDGIRNILASRGIRLPENTLEDPPHETVGGLGNRKNDLVNAIIARVGVRPYPGSVQAGAVGHFGLVIGVARKANAEELQHQGAHLVVNDLSELVD